jgi:hemerythrin-like metal-binding protein
MPLFEWKDEYSVGVNELNLQHKKIIQLLNELYEAMRDRKPKETLGKILDNMTTYAAMHFQTEEKYMKKYDYPGMDAHKKQHEDFVAKVIDFKEKFHQGSLMLSLDVLNFLKSWLKEHIMGADKEYAPFFEQKGLN